MGRLITMEPCSALARVGREHEGWGRDPSSPDDPVDPARRATAAARPDARRPAGDAGHCDGKADLTPHRWRVINRGAPEPTQSGSARR